MSEGKHSARRRIILQDVISLKGTLYFFRSEITDFKEIFTYLFSVVDTPQWKEEHECIFIELKLLSRQLRTPGRRISWIHKDLSKVKPLQ
jgi:hypothetical protein